jgi:hypothetical protein
VEQKVLESNPLLEAFGNAKTVRNDNSSRFGKFVEIQFDSNWRISGAAIRTYLLERSRLVSINDPERNYHIFYQLCDGAPPGLKTELFLKETKDFNYLNPSTCFALDGVDNAKEFKRTKHAMKVGTLLHTPAHSPTWYAIKPQVVFVLLRPIRTDRRHFPRGTARRIQDRRGRFASRQHFVCRGLRGRIKQDL